MGKGKKKGGQAREEGGQGRGEGGQGRGEGGQGRGEGGRGRGEGGRGRGEGGRGRGEGGAWGRGDGGQGRGEGGRGRGEGGRGRGEGGRGRGEGGRGRGEGGRGRGEGGRGRGEGGFGRGGAWGRGDGGQGRGEGGWGRGGAWGRGEGAPGRGEGAPGRGQGVVPGGQDGVWGRGGAWGRGEGAPGRGQGVVSGGQDGVWGRGGAWGRGEGAPGRGEVAPGRGQGVVPGGQDGGVWGRGGAWGRGEGVPGRGEGAPGRGEVAPGRGQGVVPGGQDGGVWGSGQRSPWGGNGDGAIQQGGTLSITSSTANQQFSEPSQDLPIEQKDVSATIHQQQKLSPPSAPTSEDPAQKLSAIERLGLKHKSAIALIPPLRKKIGTLGRTLNVETNHLSFNIRIKEIIHYDVAIEPDKSKKLFRMVMEAVRQKFYPERYPAFDGKKNLYSSGPLNLPQEFSETVTIRDEERQKDIEFKVTIKFAARIDTSTLTTYMKQGSSTGMPQRAIQAIDIVLRSAPGFKFTPVGRSFFTPPHGRTTDLGDGVELWYGFYQSAILGWKPFLNIDVAHKGFPKSQTCLDVINELCGNPNSDLDFRQKEKLGKYLKGLKVNYEIPEVANSRRTYKVNGLKDSALQESFTHDGKMMTIKEYYERVKGYRLQFPHLPCLHLGSPHKTMFMPIELCTVIPGQVINRKLNEMQTRAMVRAAVTRPDERKSKIMNTLGSVNFGGNPTLREFGIDIGKSFEIVPARILNPPQLTNGVVEKGVWRASKFVEGKDLLDWTIMNLDYRTRQEAIDGFARLMVSNGEALGMKINKPRIESANIRQRNWFECFNPKHCGKPDIMVVIVPDQKGIYEKVKQTAELNYGILTQCIKASTISRMKPATVSNILLKVNAKLNGMNQVIRNRVTCFNRPCMIVGADVTHPSPDAINTPSAAAVAASLDVQAFKYAMEYRLQSPRVEIIEDLENIMKNHLLKYYRKNAGAKPEKIIMFRDGVSDGQFALVLNEELMAIRRACKSLGPDYEPKITFLVVQKRHHTRFFPTDRRDSDKNGNVPAGTIVDSQITHPTELDFYLVSHASIQGTSRPTKYHLLWDDSDFSTDELEELTYHLCHMFSRCTRSVSYPAPTYYAHLGAFRARVYIGDSGINLDKLQQEQDSRRICDEITQNWPMHFV